MTTKLPDPRRLSDALLALEISHAQKTLTSALANRRNRWNPSEAGGYLLDDAVVAAERHLSACLAEQEARRSQNRWNPRTPSAVTTVVKKASPPPKTRRLDPAPLPSAPGVRNDDNDAPEGVPIIVFDKGVPRAWRKGDPIY